MPSAWVMWSKYYASNVEEIGESYRAGQANGCLPDWLSATKPNAIAGLEIVASHRSRPSA